MLQVKVSRYNSGINDLVHKTETIIDWEAATQMANLLWENADDAVAITNTVFASGINRVSVASKRRIIFQITEVDDRKKQPVQTSIFSS